MEFVSGDLVLLAVAEFFVPILDHTRHRQLCFRCLHRVFQHEGPAVLSDVTAVPFHALSDSGAVLTPAFLRRKAPPLPSELCACAYPP